MLLENWVVDWISLIELSRSYAALYSCWKQKPGTAAMQQFHNIDSHST